MEALHTLLPPSLELPSPDETLRELQKQKMSFSHSFSHSVGPRGHPLGFYFLLLLLHVAPPTQAFRLHQPWSNKTWCASVKEPQWPFSYSKYSGQTEETKGRVNIDDQDMRHGKYCMNSAALPPSIPFLFTPSPLPPHPSTSYHPSPCSL